MDLVVRLCLYLDYAAVLALVWQCQVLRRTFALVPLLRVYLWGVTALACWFALVDSVYPAPIVAAPLSVQIRFAMARLIVALIAGVGAWRAFREQGY